MASITLRLVKGSRLTYAEVDDNFSNLNTALIAAEADIDTLEVDVDAVETDVTTLFNRSPINLLINGDFRLWQRGTSFTASTGFAADRWRYSFGNGSGTVSRQSFTIGQTAVPGEPQYFYRHDRTGASTVAASALAQRIESVRTFAGQTATFGFWARAISSDKTLVPRIVQVFGTGGSPSASVTIEGGAISISASNWTYFTQTFSVPSIAGKTLGTNNDDFLQLDVTETSGFSTFTVDFSRMQFENGARATTFKYRPIQQEIELAQRYYEKTYNDEVVPGTITTIGQFQERARGTEASTALNFNWLFSTRKRATPTVTIHSPGTGAAGNMRNSTAGTDLAAIAQQPSQNSVVITNNAATTSGNLYTAHAVADAEL